MLPCLGIQAGYVSVSIWKITFCYITLIDQLVESSNPWLFLLCIFWLYKSLSFGFSTFGFGYDDKSRNAQLTHKFTKIFILNHYASKNSNKNKITILFYNFFSI